MSKYWEEEVEMYSPEELDEYYASQEDETIERDLDRREK